MERESLGGRIRGGLALGLLGVPSLSSGSMTAHFITSVPKAIDDFDAGTEGDKSFPTNASGALCGCNSEKMGRCA